MHLDENLWRHFFAEGPASFVWTTSTSGIPQNRFTVSDIFWVPSGQICFQDYSRSMLEFCDVGLQLHLSMYHSSN